MSTTLHGPLPVAGFLETRSQTALNRVGTRAIDADGNEYIYGKADGVIAAGAPVSITAGATATLSDLKSSADVKGFVGIAPAATAFADNDYGFFLTRGRGLGLVPSGAALGDPLTAGNGALSSTLTNAVKHVTVLEAPVLLSGTTQLKYVWLHG